MVFLFLILQVWAQPGLRPVPSEITCSAKLVRPALFALSPYEEARRAASRERYTREFLNLEPTDEAQNVAWLAAQNDNQPQVNVTADFANLKVANDTFKDKNFVTALGNHFKTFLNVEMSRLIVSNPGLEERRAGETSGMAALRQSDWKSLRLSFRGKIPANLDAQLDATFRRALGEFVDEVSSRNLIRSTDDPRTWFRLGRGATADWADLMAREARTLEGENRLVSDQDPLALKRLDQRFQAAQKAGVELEARFSGTALLLDGTPTVRLFDLIKKFNAADRLAQVLRRRFKLPDFSPADAQLLLDYDKMVNAFSPGIHSTVRSLVNLDGATRGGVTIDFRGMGASNQRATAVAVRRARSTTELVGLARAGEQSVTSEFRAKMQRLQELRPSMKCSGDDCAEEMSLREMRALLVQLNADPSLRETRVAYVRDGVARDRERNILATHGESLEKYLRGFLEDELAPEILDGLTFAVRMQTTRLYKGQVEIEWRGPKSLTAQEAASVEAAWTKAIAAQNQFVVQEDRVDSTYSEPQPHRFTLNKFLAWPPKK